MSLEENKEEQIGEIEALESIYPDELTVLETEPFHVFTLDLSSQETNEEDREQDAVHCRLKFSFTAEYPHELPMMEVDPEEEPEEEGEEPEVNDTISPERHDELITLMKQQGEESIGMAMVFTMVAAVIEKLNEYFDQNTKEREEAVERAKEESEAEERKKFEGTRCTVENFMSWKMKFNAERAAERKARKEAEIDASKPTGYELFMRDSTLEDSDLKFLEMADEGAAVDVDESLFDDLDDLDLEEEIS